MGLPRARLSFIPANPLREIEKLFKPSIEITGNGSLLCYDGFAGRWFRSSEVCVQEAVDKFIDLYKQGNYICWNDLHALFGITPTHFGNRYGYAGNEDYRSCTDLQFDITRIPADENFEDMGEEVLVIEPCDEYSYPYDFYMEV